MIKLPIKSFDIYIVPMVHAGDILPNTWPSWAATFFQKQQHEGNILTTVCRLCGIQIYKLFLQSICVFCIIF